MMVEDNIEALVDLAALRVAEDMERRPVTDADGIWRFDRIVSNVMGRNEDGPNRDREFWREVERLARAKNASKDTWDCGGFGLVASYAQCAAAYATPGFAEAKRFNDKYGS